MPRRGHVATTATIIVGVLLLGAGCSRSPQPFKFDGTFEFSGDEVRVPLQVVNGCPIVEVRFNGTGPYPFLLDSGCNAIVVSKEVVQAGGLRPANLVVITTNTHGQKFRGRVHNLDVMELGGARLQRVAVEQYDFVTPDAQGVLGMSYFTGYRVRLDLPGQLLTLRKPQVGDATPDPGLPMELKNGRPYVSLQIGNQARPFLIDSGKGGGLEIPQSVVSELACYPEHYGEFQYRAGGVTRLCGRTRLKDNLQIGHHTIDRPYIEWEIASPDRFLLGSEILRHFAVEFDFAEARVRFLRNASDPIRTPNRRALPVFFGRDTNGTMTATQLLPRPASQAAGSFSLCSQAACDHGLGVCAGDQVVSIEGQRAVDVSESAIKTMVRQRDHLQFVVRRNGILHTNDVPVWEDSFSPAPR